MAERTPELERGDGTLGVADRWTYRWAASRRPRIHPVATPAGHLLTVDVPDDHPWHHGLWFTIKFVDGDNYWEEIAPYGVLRHVAEPTVAGRSLSGELDWVAPDRETVVIRERRTISHVEIDAGAYALDLSVELTAPKAVELDRTPFNGEWGGYGGLTMRGQPGFVDTRLLLPARPDAGGVEVDRVLGRPAPWLAIDGTVDGSPVGMAMLDAPTNPSHPVPWYASTRAGTYGEGWANFVNAAFLWDGPRSLPAGEPLRFDYRVCIHDGRWDPDRVHQEHAAYRAALGGS
jgi:hypothetical protein